MEMSSKTQKNPSIRFKGFTDAWEQRKLGDMVEFFSGLTYSPDNVIKQPGTLVLRSSNVQNGEIVNADNVYVDNEVVNSDNVQVGDIAVVVRNGSRSLIGKHAAIKYPMKDTVIGAFMTGVRSDTPSFTNALLDTQQFETEIAKNLGATINQITTGNFKKMIFNFPEIDERLRIGDFFNQLDNTIALHQRQLENYSQLKNAMIQKIFNKELRFKNENGNDYSDWEKKRLGEILAEVVRKSTKQDQHVILSSTNKGLFLQSEYFISNIASADNIGYKIMKKSEIVFSPQNLWMGNINYNDKYEIGLVSPSYKIFAISEEVIPKFMKFMIKTPYLMNEYLLSSEQGASVVRRNLDMDLFNKILVEIPSLPEQHQIASFLVALDCNIDQLTRKIELVKDKKKGLLQLMFI